MKKILPVVLLALFSAILFSNNADAQYRNNKKNDRWDRYDRYDRSDRYDRNNRNDRYRNQARFYYFPELNIYHDVQKNEYIYPKNNNGKWTESRKLPREYNRYNLYNMYKVPIYEKNNPQRYNREHINKYARRGSVGNVIWDIFGGSRR